MGNSGRKFSLDKKKVKALYQAMLYGGIQIKYIAYNLGVRENTLRSWIDAGNTLCEAYEDKLEELAQPMLRNQYGQYLMHLVRKARRKAQKVKG